MNQYALFEEEQPELCPNGHGVWRVIACHEGKEDTLECNRCGKKVKYECTAGPRENNRT